MEATVCLRYITAVMARIRRIRHSMQGFVYINTLYQGLHIANKQVLDNGKATKYTSVDETLIFKDSWVHITYLARFT